MKKIRLFYLRWSVLAFLLFFVFFASISSEIGEWYAISIYPKVSRILSALSSLVHFSLDEWLIIVAFSLLIGLPFYRRVRQRCGWFRILVGEVEIVLWIYVWFYWGWGMNYYRADFFQRAEVSRVTYNEECFKDFLRTYTEGLNQAFHDCYQEGWMASPDLFKAMSDITSVVRGKTKHSAASVLLNDSDPLPLTITSIHDEIKRMYAKVPVRFGLCLPQSYQFPKRSSFNSLYSNVGVLGFMGPFFAESHVNLELSMIEYPFTYAHELSHLLGISSEAEANFWAYTVCTQHEHPLIRLSGYMGLLAYVRSNVFYLLPSDQYEKWESSLPSEIRAAFYRIHAYWSLRYNETLGEMQSAIYTFYLKRNKITSGQKNYAQVIGMLLSLPDFGITLK